MNPQRPSATTFPKDWWPPNRQRRLFRTRSSWTAPAALMMAAAALATAIVGLTHSFSNSSAAGALSAPSATTGALADNSSRDRALCAAIAPLMAADDRASNAFIDTGPAGSTERDAAQAKYRSDTEVWITQIQPIADAHRDADPFLLRTLQRFVDDRNLMVRNMRPGPARTYDDEIWADSLAALGGPMSVCYQLGVKW